MFQAQHLLNLSEYDPLSNEFSNLSLVGVEEAYMYWDIALSG